MRQADKVSRAIVRLQRRMKVLVIPTRIVSLPEARRALVHHSAPILTNPPQRLFAMSYLSHRANHVVVVIGRDDQAVRGPRAHLRQHILPDRIVLLWPGRTANHRGGIGLPARTERIGL